MKKYRIVYRANNSEYSRYVIQETCSFLWMEWWEDSSYNLDYPGIYAGSLEEAQKELEDYQKWLAPMPPDKIVREYL